MEFEKKNNFQEVANSDDSISVVEVVEKYLIHWKWFLLAVILGVVFAYVKLNFERPQYEATATIKIKNEQSGDRTALSAFQDLGVMSPANQNVEDEMEILLSKDLIAEVIKSLKLNIRIFTNKNYLSEFIDNIFSFNTEFYETEEYVKPPININFFISDSVLNRTNAEFLISINSINHFNFINYKNSIDKRYNFGEKIKTHFGDLVITPNVNLEGSSLIGSKVLVKISPVRRLAALYAEKIGIEPKSQYSSILSLKISDGAKKKAEAFLNELVKKYNNRAISIKEELTKSTSDFVTKRLEIISTELSDVDLSAESIKTRYGLSDVASTTSLSMQSGQAIENQIVQANTELEKISYIKEFVATKDENDLIPIDVGIADNNISSTMQQYNQLMMEKKRLLENSTEKNPIVVNLNEQLKTLKSNIDQGLNNLESSQNISLEALNEQDIRINSRLYSAPKQERQYRDIQRQQQIKEALYLYLLQKREETAITLGVADPNAKIIDYPESRPNPISPKRMRIYFMFILMGLIIPFGIIYTSYLLDNKIHNREDVEKVLNIPIIGDIPLSVSKKPYLISKEDYSSMAEAFRILRTNLNFILQNSNDKNAKIIFVTSTIAHEGKSLVATNLAASLAQGGKRTLILGMDIRAPKLKSYLGVRGDIGIANFIINRDLTIADITLKSPRELNLNIISSGDIAPNPAELLMNSRIKEIFKTVKENYDYVIVDTAAFSMVTDTLLLSTFADAFIYVIRADFLDKRMLRYIQNIYNEKRLPNMSLLINGIDNKKSQGYGYGYGPNFDKPDKRSWWKFKNN